jgi:hypothetical protein
VLNGTLMISVVSLLAWAASVALLSFDNIDKR